jgi:hypothetical protein
MLHERSATDQTDISSDEIFASAATDFMAEKPQLGYATWQRIFAHWPEKSFKVLHLRFTFAPDPVGGTENLCRGPGTWPQIAHGVEPIIVAPSSDGVDVCYQHNSLDVRRVCSTPASRHMLRELYGEGDPQAVAAFARILDE